MAQMFVVLFIRVCHIRGRHIIYERLENKAESLNEGFFALGSCLLVGVLVKRKAVTTIPDWGFNRLTWGSRCILRCTVYLLTFNYFYYIFVIVMSCIKKTTVFDKVRQNS